jgi:hypothetical protein
MAMRKPIRHGYGIAKNPEDEKRARNAKEQSTILISNIPDMGVLWL